MKFKIGDETDSAHCTVLKHEFLQCEDAFKDFEHYAGMMIMRAQAEAQQGKRATAHENRLIAYRTYNAYGKFLHHLYEFLIGARAREAQDTSKITAEVANGYIAANAQKVLNGKRNAILNGTAPAWENALSYYPEKVPEDFASDFRKHRNKISAHVTYERSNISLSSFYEKYHKYVYMQYWNCLGHWGMRNEEFPDLKEITKFSVLIKRAKDDPAMAGVPSSFGPK